jgi:hypothetical protein
MQEPLSQHKVEKNEETADWLDIQFNNLDGEPLVFERVDFIRVLDCDQMIITAKRPSTTVRSAVSEECYDEDFKFHAAEWFKLPVSQIIVKWIDKL